MTQQTEPPVGCNVDEFNAESYHCLKHLQDFSNIVQAAMPTVMAWWEVGEHHLVPDEIEVRWRYEPGIDNTIGNRVTNRTPQMIACRPSQVGGVPSHHNVELHSIGSSSSSDGADVVYAIATEPQLDPIIEEGTSGLASALRSAGVPGHVDASYPEQRVEPTAAAANRPPYLQRTTGQAMGVDQRRTSSITPPPAIIRPPWVCCAHGRSDPVIERWYDYMKALPVDEAGLQSAIALAQYDPQGYAKLAEIIEQVKEGRHSSRVDNWSAWFAKAVKSARHQLNPEGALRFGGMSRSQSSPAVRRT